MPINSASSDDEVLNAYADNASYHETANAGMAASFVTACRVLLIRLPRMTSSGDSSTQLNPDLIQDEMRRAEQWLASNGPTVGGVSAGGRGEPRVSRVSFNNFR